MRVVISSSPGLSVYFLLFHITCVSCYCIEVWISGSEPTIIRRSALVQNLSVRKDPGPYLADSSQTKLLLHKYALAWWLW